jgi:hypothetical protein
MDDALPATCGGTEPSASGLLLRFNWLVIYCRDSVVQRGAAGALRNYPAPRTTTPPRKPHKATTVLYDSFTSPATKRLNRSIGLFAST